MFLHLFLRPDEAARDERTRSYDWSPADNALCTARRVTTIRADFPTPRAEGQVQKRWRGLV